ncbi:MAG: histidine phosphatase family protein, partial [Ornithinimicrobium sp.]
PDVVDASASSPLASVGMETTRLVLIRHAKTEQQGPPTQGDHGRALLPRGEGDGQAAGRWLVGEGLVPDLVLCSTAVRAVQTWQAMVAGSDELADVEVWRDRRIYDASPGEVLEVLAEVPDAVGTVAIVGHAPGIPALVAELTDPERADEQAVELFNTGFPTMTSAVLFADGPLSGASGASMRLSTVNTARADD